MDLSSDWDVSRRSATGQESLLFLHAISTVWQAKEHANRGESRLPYPCGHRIPWFARRDSATRVPSPSAQAPATESCFRIHTILSSLYKNWLLLLIFFDKSINHNETPEAMINAWNMKQPLHILRHFLYFVASYRLSTVPLPTVPGSWAYWVSRSPLSTRPLLLRPASSTNRQSMRQWKKCLQGWSIDNRIPQLHAYPMDRNVIEKSSRLWAKLAASKRLFHSTQFVTVW